MSVYYNDSEPFVCAWLRNLIAAGLIPAGDVDERPIQEVSPDDVRGYTQAHFFAGIGGWAYALQLAEWGDRPVWTGSCPCQPFSAAGKRGSHADTRHLWPAWYRLISECRPLAIFGEQVSGAAGLGWLDAVALDLEAVDYAIGACVLGAHSVGAPHIRQRLWFVAESDKGRRWQDGKHRGSEQQGKCRDVGSHNGPATADSGTPGGVADALHGGASQHAGERQHEGGSQPRSFSETSELADADGGESSDRDVQRSGEHGQRPQNGGAGFWDTAVWIPCRDGKARPVEPGTFPLAHGVPARVGRLRAYGNAIVPQVAAAFVRAYLELGPLFDAPTDTFAAERAAVAALMGKPALRLEPPSVPVDTSQAAAQAIKPSAAAIRDRVHDFLARCAQFGATEQEVEAALALPGNTVRQRLWELEGNGGHERLIAKTLRTRPTRSGRRARVYVALSCAP